MTTQKSINLSNYYIRKNGENRDLSTQSKDGLMSKEDKTKLDGVATQANNYSHPTHTGYENGLYKITTNTLGHVISATPVTKQDITSLGIADASALSSTLSYEVISGSVSQMQQAANQAHYSGISNSEQGDIFKWYFEEVKQLEPEENIIYLLENNDNHFNEYLCMYDETNDEYTFELLGSTKIDLTNYIQKSQTSGLIKNDGTIDTNTYLTSVPTGSSSQAGILQLGTTASTAAQGNHQHGSITTDGKIGTTSGKILTTGANGIIQASNSIETSQISNFPTIPSNTSDLVNDGDGTDAFLTTGAYKYSIMASSYNIKLGGSATITVKVTNQLGTPIPNEPVTIYRNGNAWLVDEQTGVTGITDSNGEITKTFAPTLYESLGISNFRVDNQNIQVNVKGWIKITGTAADQYYNEEYAYLVMHYGSSVADGSTINLNSNMTPFAGIPTFTSANRQYTVKIEGNTATISLNSGAAKTSVYGAVLYRRA